MSRFFLLISVVLCFALISSCKDRMICPAFQSTYILEEEAGNQMFSLFGEDSLPKYKVLQKKDRYGMMVKVKYKRRVNDMRTVRMKNVLPPPQEDTLDVYESFADLDNDTLMLEASETSNVRNFKYNYDQQNYMKYIGDDIAKAFERKQNEITKAKQEKEEKEALEPVKKDRKARREEKLKKKNEEKEKKKNKDGSKEEEEEVDEWDMF